MLYAPLSMLGSPDGTGCDGLRVPVHSGSNSIDVNMAGMCVVSLSV